MMYFDDEEFKDETPYSKEIIRNLDFDLQSFIRELQTQVRWYNDCFNSNYQLPDTINKQLDSLQTIHYIKEADVSSITPLINSIDELISKFNIDKTVQAHKAKEQLKQIESTLRDIYYVLMEYLPYA